MAYDAYRTQLTYDVTAIRAVGTVGVFSGAGLGVIVMCTASGNVDFTMVGGGTLPSVPVATGFNFFPFNVSAVVASGTGGATFTAYEAS